MTADHELQPRSTSLFGDQEVALVDLLDRLLAGGVVLTGDLTISLAGVDLVRISLRALITSIAPVERTVPLQARAERQSQIGAGDD
ncbi:gas vesicle protein [Actinomycetospora endophytica]|uniref:Gas vesicle protein n=1 Tax=Actinomycetospora endophytica TaxID=2291215 RepID=A0ABS8PL41_9PSEU|nr:gas vesicle protein [Actinomycetospora endophytica]MCD2198116.1 gas vesicle protein [Actinomycetospora endophytica]